MKCVSLLRQLASSRDGNFAVTLSLAIIPLVLALGFGVDYSSAVNQRSTMRNALDAAAFAAMKLPMDASRADRQKLLSDTYVGNGGIGTAAIVGEVTVNDGVVVLRAEAKADMDTSFMALGGASTVPIAVTSTVGTPVKITEASFRLKQMTGVMDKTVTLMGREKNEKHFKPLAQVGYWHNGRGTRGVGDMVLQRIKDGVAIPVSATNCYGVANAPSQCRKVAFSNNGVATIDLSDIEDMHLRVDFEGHKQRGVKTIDIMQAASCGEWKSQASGQGDGETPPEGAGFDIKAKCDWGGQAASLRLLD